MDLIKNSKIGKMEVGIWVALYDKVSRKALHLF